MLRIAVAGAPLTTPSPGGTVAGLKRAHALGISAMELEWVEQVPKNPERMAEIKETAESLDMTLTVHAPYYINLNSPEPEKLAASKKRILDALTMAQAAGATSVCVHAAFNMSKPPKEVMETVSDAVADILQERDKRGVTVNLGLETMGKSAQFGTLEEVLAVSKKYKIYPVLDPAHMYARTQGGWNTAAEWHAMFDAYEKALGKKSLQKVHMHYSGIEYSSSGERRHLPLQESGNDWRTFLSVLHEREISGTLVCESPLMEEDTLLLQNFYHNLS